MMVMGCAFSCLDPVLSVVTALDYKSPFHISGKVKLKGKFEKMYRMPYGRYRTRYRTYLFVNKSVSIRFVYEIVQLLMFPRGKCIYFLQRSVELKLGTQNRGRK